MMRVNNYDSLLLIGFGGPTPGCCKKQNPCPGEAHCFVEGIVGAVPSHAARVKEVESHYVALGGFSPFNELTFQQADALKSVLKAKGIELPIYTGMRNWTPYLRDVMAEILRNGHQNILGIILSAYQSKSSWERYQNDINEAVEAANAPPPNIDYLEAWYMRSGFINAIAGRIREACEEMDKTRFERASLIFTAHSIPQPAAKASPYTQQFQQTAAAVAQALGKDFDIAYQSAPDTPIIPWTSPDINDLIRDKKAAGITDVIVSPIGFLCDHVEVLYDLDLEAKATAKACGVGFVRAGTVSDHPAFIEMLARRIDARLKTRR
jgi:protoporphyrin/coproporphyrin ferrochelatase